MSDTDPAPDKPPVDWQGIEMDYRCGIKVLRQIADQHGVTHAAIIKRAKRDDWARDLAAKIKAKAKALVTKSAVTKEVTKARRDTEQAAVDANATLAFNVQMAHRVSLQKLSHMRDELMAKLRADKDMDLPQRADVLKKLVEVDERLRKGQREAFNITEAAGNDTPRVLTDVERAHRLSAWLSRVQDRIAGEASQAAATIDAQRLPGPTAEVMPQLSAHEESR